MADLLVRRDDMRQLRVDADGEAADLEPGEVRFRVESFGLTANNLSYAVFGDELGYWRFFPAPEGWGRVPAWGFGRVIESKLPEIAEGARFYGYWPMSTTVVMRPGPGPQGFTETAEHRADLPAFYNLYLEADGSPAFDPALDGFNAVLRPLFGTGWLIAHQLERAGWHGAGAVVLASASSKTAYSAAFEISRRPGSPSLVGLTSAGNREFTESLGCYDAVLTYDQIEELVTAEGLVLVDMAGDPAVRRAVHEHARDDLKASLSVGGTHWEEASLQADELPGPTPEFFFAPAVAEALTAESGPEAMQEDLGAAAAAFIQKLGRGLEIEIDSGPEATQRVWLSLVEGTADPRKGYVLSL
jgi:hypothetical protein